MDGSGNNPEGIQVRNGKECSAFNGAVGPLEVRQKVNGVWSLAAKTSEKKKVQSIQHFLWLKRKPNNFFQGMKPQILNIDSDSKFSYFRISSSSCRTGEKFC